MGVTPGGRGPPVSGASGHTQRRTRPPGRVPRCLATARLLFRGRLERKARKTVSPHGPGPARAVPSLTAPGTEAFASACRVRAHGASRAHPHAFPRPATGTGPGCSPGPRGREGGGALTLVPLSPAGSRFNPALGTAGAPGSGGARTGLLPGIGRCRAPCPQALQRGSCSQRCPPQAPEAGSPVRGPPSQTGPLPVPAQRVPHLTNTCPASGPRETHDSFCSA